MTCTTQLNRLPQLRGLAFAACLVLAGPAFAQSPGAPLPFDGEARLVAQLEEATGEQLKAIYTACSKEAETRLLGVSEAAACSIVYETLKRRVFGGDFAALLAWSRSQRPTASGPRSEPAGRNVTAR